MIRPARRPAPFPPAHAGPSAHLPPHPYPFHAAPGGEMPGEECGVVLVFNHPEAAKLAYLGLYALQHRRQEAAGEFGNRPRISHSGAVPRIPQVKTTRWAAMLAVACMLYSSQSCAAVKQDYKWENYFHSHAFFMSADYASDKRQVIVSAICPNNYSWMHGPSDEGVMKYRVIDVMAGADLGGWSTDFACFSMVYASRYKQLACAQAFGSKGFGLCGIAGPEMGKFTNLIATSSDITQVAYSPISDAIAFSGHDVCQLVAWEGKTTKSMKLDASRSLAFLDKNVLLAADSNGVVRTLDFDSMTSRVVFNAGSASRVAISRDAKLCCAIDNNLVLRVCETKFWRVIFRERLGAPPANGSRDVCFSGDGTKIGLINGKESIVIISTKDYSVLGRRSIFPPTPLRKIMLMDDVSKVVCLDDEANYLALNYADVIDVCY